MNAVHLIINAKSGSGNAAEIPRLLQKRCDDFKRQLFIHAPTTPEDFENTISSVVERARDEKSLIIAAGGDGTIRSIAQKVLNQDVQFAIIPVGTYNYYAREHHVSENFEEAIETALTGKTIQTQVATLNDLIFLNNASIGLYVESLRNRERWTAKLGRNRLVVALSTIYSLFTPKRALNLDLQTLKASMQRKTLMIFVGNNALQLQNLNLPISKCIDQDRLAVILLRPIVKWQFLKLLFRGITKTLQQEENLEAFCAKQITINCVKKTQDVVLDGEIFHLETPFVLKCLPASLNLVVPSL